MNEVNKTLYIPLYGKAQVSQKGIILHDPTAERIWKEEAFPIKGKSKSKWLTYNMAMRARVFDDWTVSMLGQYRDAVVLHIGCGLDSRCLRVNAPCAKWIDGDFPDVIALRKRYFDARDNYETRVVDASKAADIEAFPEGETAVVILEGISMYLSDEQLNGFFIALEKKYATLHILMDVYTDFGARASKFKNPVNDVGVTNLYGRDQLDEVLRHTRLRLKAEHSFTPEQLVNELRGFERGFFKLMFTGKLYGRLYRLYELETQ